MPEFLLTSPEGKQYRVTGPEGSTGEQALAHLQQQLGLSPGQEKSVESIPSSGSKVLDILTQGPRDIIAGLKEQFTEPRGTSFIDLALPSAPARIIKGVAETAAAPVSAALRGVGELASKGIGAVLPEKFTPSPETIETGLSLGGPRGGVMPVQGPFIPKPTGPLGGAQKQIEKAFTRDQPLESKAKMPETTLADIGGKNVHGVLEHLAQTPGEAGTTVTRFLEKRQQEQINRLSDDLTKLTGSKRTAREAVDETIHQRRTESAPLWQQAYQEGDRAIWNPKLERLTASPDVQDAMHSAVRSWQTTQIADGYGAMNPGAKVDRGGILSFLHGKVPVFPNLQFWDYTKGALDAQIEKEITADGTMTRRGRNLSIIVKQLLDVLDSEVGSYKAARDKWAGYQSHLNAIRMGKNFLSNKMPAEEKIAFFNDLSEADKQGAREGLVSAILGKWEGNAAKLPDLTRDVRSPGMRKVITAFMPNKEAAQKWDDRLAFEMQSSKMVGAGLSGSATYRRAAQAADESEMMGDLVWETIMGHKVSAATRVFRAISNKWRANAIEKRNAESAKILTGKPEQYPFKKPTEHPGYLGPFDYLSGIERSPLKREVIERGRSGRPIKTKPITKGRNLVVLEKGFERTQEILPPAKFKSESQLAGISSTQKARLGPMLKQLVNLGATPEQLRTFTPKQAYDFIKARQG